MIQDPDALVAEIEAREADVKAARVVQELMAVGRSGDRGRLVEIASWPSAEVVRKALVLLALTEGAESAQSAGVEPSVALEDLLRAQWSLPVLERVVVA